MRKAIAGYEGLYEIDDEGTVYTLRRGQSRVMRPAIDRDGYLQLVLTDTEHRRKRFFIHRLVAIEFIDNPDRLPQVNHLDGDKSNNRADNLEWCDAKRNNLHSHRTGLHPSDKLGIEDARAIRNEYRKGQRGCGMRALAKKYGVSVAHICHIIQGKKLGEVMPQ